MKLQNLFIIIIVLLLGGCKAKENNFTGFETTIVNGIEIPIINLEQVEDSAKIINLSALVSNIDIIPLETKKECLIGNAFPHFSDSLLFVWTQAGRIAYLYEFDQGGKFIRRIGKVGKGPGEYSGYALSVRWMETYDDKNQIGVDYSGLVGKGPMMYEYNGKYLYDIVFPGEMMSSPARFNDSIWFTVGNIVGPPRFKRDSNMLVFFNRFGETYNKFPRTKYIKAKQGKYSPSSWGISVYNYNNEWRVYNPGNDTLYKVDLEKLTPVAVFHRGEKGSPYNEHISPNEIIGKYNFSILQETENYLIINKSFITMAELSEYRPGEFGGMFDISEFLIIIDKKTGKLHNVRIQDDILGYFSAQLMTDYDRFWQKGFFSASKSPFELKEEISDKLNNEELPEGIRSKLTELNNKLSVDDNPVVFRFKLLDKFDLN